MSRLKAVRDTTTDTAQTDMMIKSCDMRQWVQKVIVNSIYGAISFSSYPSYSPVSGMSVTSIGRWMLNVCIVVTMCIGHTVVYGDTDSVMLCLFPIRGSSGSGQCRSLAGRARRLLRRFHSTLIKTSLCSIRLQIAVGGNAVGNVAV